MDHLFKRLEEIRKDIKAASKVFLFLDYDGTLTEIVSDPDKAFLSGEMKSTLGRLKDAPGVSMAIVSGRFLEDIEDRVGLDGIFYLGNHGLEIRRPTGKTNRALPNEVVEQMELICDRLAWDLREIRGVLVEDKKYALAVHYRNVDPKNISAVLKRVKDEVSASPLPLFLSSGKKVIEIRPNSGINKGTAVLDLLAEYNEKAVLPIYIGDDRTDEDAFITLKRRGITLVVARSRSSASSAQYYVRDPSEVLQFLNLIHSDIAMDSPLSLSISSFLPKVLPSAKGRLNAV